MKFLKLAVLVFFLAGHVAYADDGGGDGGSDDNGGASESSTSNDAPFNNTAVEAAPLPPTSPSDPAYLNNNTGPAYEPMTQYNSYDHDRNPNPVTAPSDNPADQLPLPEE